MILLIQHFRTPLGKKLGVTKFNAYNNSQIHRLKVKKNCKKKKENYHGNKKHHNVYFLFIQRVSYKQLLYIIFTSQMIESIYTHSSHYILFIKRNPCSFSSTFLSFPFLMYTFKPSVIMLVIPDKNLFCFSWSYIRQLTSFCMIL